MNARLARLARERQALVERSALARLRLCRDTQALRETFGGKAAIVATATPLRRAAFGLAWSVAGYGATARWIRLAGRVLVIARIARFFIQRARFAAPRLTP